MLPQVIKQLAPLLAGAAAGGSFASGQAVAQYAAPAVATRSTGLFGGKRVITPLSEPLAGIDIPKYTPPPPAKLETGAIEGVKAAASEAAGPNVAVAIFVGAGSANETPATAGASKLLEYLAFSATSNRSTFRLTRELEKYGAAAAALAGREAIAYGVEGTKLQAAEVTEILLDAVLNMRLNYWEINDIIPHVQADMERAYAQPGALATELLHRAAFSGGLAQPLLPDPDVIGALTPEAVHAFVEEHFTAGNISLAASGASLKALELAAAPLLAAGTRGGAAPAAPASKYTGGVVSAVLPGSAPFVALAYQAPGGLSDIKATAVTAVVKALLNDGRAVLPYAESEPPSGLDSVTPVVHVYKSTGLVGLLGSPSSPSGAQAAIDAFSSRFEALAKGAPAPALAAAKAVALGGYRAATATKSGAVQDLAQQLLARGKADAADYAAAVAGLTAADVSGAVSAMLKGPPTLVAGGPLSELPKFDSVARRFS